MVTYLAHSQLKDYESPKVSQTSGTVASQSKKELLWHSRCGARWNIMEGGQGSSGVYNLIGRQNLIITNKNINYEGYEKERGHYRAWQVKLDGQWTFPWSLERDSKNEEQSMHWNSMCKGFESCRKWKEANRSINLENRNMFSRAGCIYCRKVRNTISLLGPA